MVSSTEALSLTSSLTVQSKIVCAAHPLVLIYADPNIAIFYDLLDSCSHVQQSGGMLL